MSYLVKIQITRKSRDDPYFGKYVMTKSDGDPLREAFERMRSARTSRHIQETTKFSTDGLSMTMYLDYGTEEAYYEVVRETEADLELIQSARFEYELQHGQVRHLEINAK